MSTLEYIIDDKTYKIEISGSPNFFYGKHEYLSTSKTDITYDQDWYPTGYKVFNFLAKNDHEKLKAGLTDCIKRIIPRDSCNWDTFTLEKYHQFVTTDELHYRIVSVTRDLFPEDFNFPISDIITMFENLLGFPMTDIDPHNKKPLHIIIRINRPHSTDFNPPHKDIYEGVDIEKRVPRFVNIWIPICGVTPNTSLPVAPSSHLLPEDKILRTFEGGVVAGKKYRVRTVKEWDNGNKLIRPKIEEGEALIFSPHLIHGLAVNEEDDLTRVALEFRLFKKEH